MKREELKRMAREATFSDQCPECGMEQWRRMEQPYLAGAEAVLERAQALETELRRMHNCVLTSLLEATAWMGIPLHKRDRFIKDHMQNADYILEQALKQWEKS